MIEQKRIVAILAEAFEGIDGAIANTEKNLPRFKTSQKIADSTKGDRIYQVDMQTGAKSYINQYPISDQRLSATFSDRWLGNLTSVTSRLKVAQIQESFTK
ncbi:hypothetical protein [Calothrix sp. PCC 7507]|uniref:hypothetical protein n=1 Tax=Calothrix sp. PCC 7507 TaxID=99598 RepID=UPI0003011C81|nr:hypothetical protein [Calothrix sp. PCC 7507]